LLHPGFSPEKITPDKYTAKQIGGYAWSMYGLLIFMNMRYYYDLFYRKYIVSPYGR
jgi:hypothetical protein